LYLVLFISLYPSIYPLLFFTFFFPSLCSSCLLFYTFMVACCTFWLAKSKPSCVVRKLRWLAQQGKPYGVPRELYGVAVQALRTDCLVLPAAYR
jgi:hypothetical protein